MEYVLIPNSFNRDLLNNLSDDEVLELQNKYRNCIEEKIKGIIDFKKVDDQINKMVYVPRLEDKEYNYYHKFSTFPSNYIFLRNNYHIERLSEDELEQLKNGSVDDEFLKNTFEKVLYEDGNFTYYGSPIDSYLAASKSLVIEFAYDQVEIETIEELQNVDKIIGIISDELKAKIEDSLGVPVSVIIYNGIPDLYKNNEKNVESSDIRIL